MWSTRGDAAVDREFLAVGEAEPELDRRAGRDALGAQEAGAGGGEVAQLGPLRTDDRGDTGGNPEVDTTVGSGDEDAEGVDEQQEHAERHHADRGPFERGRDRRHDRRSDEGESPDECRCVDCDESDDADRERRQGADAPTGTGRVAGSGARGPGERCEQVGVEAVPAEPQPVTHAQHRRHPSVHRSGREGPQHCRGEDRRAERSGDGHGPREQRGHDQGHEPDARVGRGDVAGARDDAGPGGEGEPLGAGRGAGAAARAGDLRAPDRPPLGGGRGSGPVRDRGVDEADEPPRRRERNGEVGGPRVDRRECPGAEGDAVVEDRRDAGESRRGGLSTDEHAEAVAAGTVDRDRGGVGPVERALDRADGRIVHGCDQGVERAGGEQGAGFDEDDRAVFREHRCEGVHCGDRAGVGGEQHRRPCRGRNRGDLRSGGVVDDEHGGRVFAGFEGCERALERSGGAIGGEYRDDRRRRDDRRGPHSRRAMRDADSGQERADADPRRDLDQPQRDRGDRRIADHGDEAPAEVGEHAGREDEHEATSGATFGSAGVALHRFLRWWPPGRGHGPRAGCSPTARASASGRGRLSGLSDCPPAAAPAASAGARQTGMIVRPVTRPASIRNRPKVAEGWRRRCVGEPGLKRICPSAPSPSKGAWLCP